MRLLNSIEKHRTKFHIKIRIISKVIKRKNGKIEFLSFMAYDFQITLQNAHKVSSSNSNFQNIGLKGLREVDRASDTFLRQFNAVNSKFSFMSVEVL